MNIKYGVYLVDVINTFERKDDIEYTLHCSTNGTSSCGNVEEATYNSTGSYEAYTRIKSNKTPSLNCTGTKLTKFKDNTDMYVGTLTTDEIVFAGADANNTKNIHHYLLNNYANFSSKGLSFWSLSPYRYDSNYYAFYMSTFGM